MSWRAGTEEEAHVLLEEEGPDLVITIRNGCEDTPYAIHALIETIAALEVQSRPVLH